MVTSEAGAPITSASSKVKAGFSVTIHVPEPVPMDVRPKDIALDIIYEDEALIVINKPVGLTVHPAPGTGDDTLVNALLHHCGTSLSGIGGVMRPGIVHRIDKDTSGLLVVAKQDGVHQHLAEQLKTRVLKRTYYAYAWGAVNPSYGKIDAPIARHPVHRKKMAVVDNGKPAISHYKTRYRALLQGHVPLATALEIQLETGRTHQIRVHFQHIGHGLIGDQTYGPSTTTRLARVKNAGGQVPEPIAACLQSVQRQALHAAKLAFIHPITKQEILCEAPLPDDLQAIENHLISLTTPT